MTNRQYVIAIIVVASLIVFFGAIFLGAEKQLNAPCENCEELIAELEAETVIPKTYGEIGQELYTIEIWEDGSAKIKTMNWHINELDENVLIVTDRAVSYKDGIIKLY